MTDLALIMVDLENERPATTVGNEKKIGSLGNAVSIILTFHLLLLSIRVAISSILVFAMRAEGQAGVLVPPLFQLPGDVPSCGEYPR